MVMAVKLFERVSLETIEDFEKRINDFLLMNNPTQIHYQDANHIYFMYHRL